MPQLVLADRIRMVDFVAQDQKGHFREILHAEEGVELGFGFGEAFVVFGVDEEDDAGHFGEVVFPETAGWRVGRGKGCVSLEVRGGGEGEERRGGGGGRRYIPC